MHYAIAGLPSRAAIIVRKVRGTGAALFRHAVPSSATASVPGIMAHIADCLPYFLGIMALLLALFLPGWLDPDGLAFAVAGMTAAVPATDPQASKQVVHTAEVIRHGQAINVPKDMSYRTAAEILLRKEQEDESLINVSRKIPVFPWEAARAIMDASTRLFGLPLALVPGYGNLISVDAGPDGSTIQVPWGRVTFVGAEAGEWLNFDADIGQSGMLEFQVVGKIKQKHNAMVTSLLDLTAELAVKDSIYRSKALRMEFSDQFGQALTIPKIAFLDVTRANIDEVVFNRDITDIVRANVVDHIRHRAALASIGVPFKMGVLFAGEYGTGKSLVARAIAKVATTTGVTFLYLKKSEDLGRALAFAQQYQPCVVFAEDVDRIIDGDDEIDGRSPMVSEIVNLLDGIDSKHAEVMVILTTNHLDRINKVLLRPGRVDVAIKVELPDAEAVGRLLRLYSRDVNLSPAADLTEAADTLAGYAPAVVREVIERAKRFMVSRTGDATAMVLASDVTIAARTVVQQAKLVAGTPDELRPEDKRDGHNVRDGLEVLSKSIEQAANSIAFTLMGERSLDADTLDTVEDLHWRLSRVENLPTVERELDEDELRQEFQRRVDDDEEPAGAADGTRYLPPELDEVASGDGADRAMLGD
jgi:hypothetical protein